jgi:hypothetical protein
VWGHDGPASLDSHIIRLKTEPPKRRSRYLSRRASEVLVVVLLEKTTPVMEQLHVADNHSLLDHDVPVWRSGTRSDSTQNYITPQFQNSTAVLSDVKGSKPKPAPILSILLDIVLILISLLFLCLAVTALCIRNRPVGDRVGAIVEEVSKVVRCRIFSTSSCLHH